MNSQHNSEICIYCGLRPNDAPDHTPSKNLFPKPAPSNLITVPSCRECNNSFSQDEEYFQTILVYSQHGEKSPNAIWDKVERGLDRETSRLFDLLVDNLKVEEETAIVEITVDHARIERILIKTLRGLYFHHFGARLIDNQWSHPRVGTVDKISSLVKRWFSNTPFIEIGKSVFLYRFVEVSDPEFSTLWQMVFYNSFSCCIGVG